MPIPSRPSPSGSFRWLPVSAVLMVVLLAVAWLTGGAGPAGVSAEPSAGAGRYIYPDALTAGEQFEFAGVDRAIGRLHLGPDGKAEQYEAYGDVLQALGDALPARPGDDAIARASLLLQESLPGGAARELVRVLPDFLTYQALERSLLELTPDGPGNAEDAWIQFVLQKALRRAVLGESVANGLYETAHRMTEIHLVRQLVMQRQDLDEDQKQRLIRQHMDALVAGQGHGEGAQ